MADKEANSASESRIYRFGAFQVDVRSGEIFKHGVRVRLQDQPFHVLVSLLERPGDVVTREELRDRVWKDNTFVDFDHSLSIAVNKIRETLCDDAANPRFIETVPRKGYRFLASVQISETLPRSTQEAPPPVRDVPRMDASVVAQTDLPVSDAVKEIRVPSTLAKRHAKYWVAAALVLIVFIGTFAWRRIHSVGGAPKHKLMLAVLPFENLTPDSAQEYFISGLNEEMIAQFGRMHANRLGVIARTSILQYKGTQKPISQIGQELNVDYIMEGSVRRIGEQIRISVQLIKVTDQTQSWAEQFERQVPDILAIQADVARRVADSLALELLPAEEAALGTLATTNMSAHEDYLRGRFYWNRRTEDDFLKAIVYFEDAIHKDPQYAEAYAGLADCYNLLGGYGIQPPEHAFPKGKAAAARALELKASLAEAHASLGFAQFYFDWDGAKAEASFRRAIDLNPNYSPARQWYSEFLHARGRFDEADFQIHRALELDPFSLAINDDFGWLLLSQRKNSRAVEQFQTAIQLDPRWANAHLSLSFGRARNGDAKGALVQIEEARKLTGEAQKFREEEAYVRALAGDKSGAEAILKELQARHGQSHASAYNIALIHTALQQKKEALKVLDQALARHDIWLVWLRVHPEWDSLRSEAQFQGVLKQIGF